MVDKVSRLDSGMHRIQEARDDRNRRGQQDEEEEESKKKKKDKFDKGKSFWKRLISDSSGATAGGTRAQLAAGTKPVFPVSERRIPSLLTPSEAGDRDEEPSLTMSQRILVLWGVLDTSGKPRVRMIAGYLVVAAVIIISTILIMGILWR